MKMSLNGNLKLTNADIAKIADLIKNGGNAQIFRQSRNSYKESILRLLAVVQNGSLRFTGRKHIAADMEMFAEMERAVEVAK